MSLKPLASRGIATASIFAVMAAAAPASDRELGAHVHGSGAFNIAFDGDAVLMELEAPGADIVGFEHEAKSAEDRAAVDAAIAKLAKPLDLFVLPADAGCVVTSANVELIAAGGGHDDHDHGDHGHSHDDDHDHDHAKKADDHSHDDHDHDHAKKDDDHAHDHDEGASHTEFHAEYALTCSDRDAIAAIDFAYFAAFPNALELDVQLISAKGAKGYEVERDAPRLDLAGAI